MSASDLPLSVLIVGVGGADFKQMEVLFIYISWCVQFIFWCICLSCLLIRLSPIYRSLMRIVEIDWRALQEGWRRETLCSLFRCEKYIVSSSCGLL